MKKRVKPVNGQPAKGYMDFLIKKGPGYISEQKALVEKDYPEMSYVMHHGNIDEVIALFKRVRTHVNVNTCLSDEQARAFTKELAIAFPYRADDAKLDADSASKKVQRLAVLINSYRVDCEYCLNGECQRRKSNISLEDVEKGSGLECYGKMLVSDILPPRESLTQGDKFLCTWLMKTLAGLNVTTVEELCDLTARDLSGRYRFGKKSLRFVRRLLASYNLKLRGELVYPHS